MRGLNHDGASLKAWAMLGSNVFISAVLAQIHLDKDARSIADKQEFIIYESAKRFAEAYEKYDLKHIDD